MGTDFRPECGLSTPDFRLSTTDYRLTRRVRYNTRMPSVQDAARCVFCRQRPVDPTWRPFCSERCKTRDLANWADATYSIAGEPFDDLSPDADPEAPHHRSSF